MNLFSINNAVYGANLGMTERVLCHTGNAILPYMQAVQAKGTILVCKPWAATLMIDEDDLPQVSRNQHRADHIRHGRNAEGLFILTCRAIAPQANTCRKPTLPVRANDILIATPPGNYPL